jgi:hypothetical protein
MKVVATVCAVVFAASLIVHADDLFSSGDGAKWTYNQNWAGTPGAWADTFQISTFTYNANGTEAMSKMYEDTASTGSAAIWILRTIGTATYNAASDSLPAKWTSATKNDKTGSWDTTNMTFTYNANNKPTAFNVKMRMLLAPGIFATIEAKADVWYNGSGQQLGDSTLVKMVIPILPNQDTTFKPSSKDAFSYGTNYKNTLKSTWDTTAKAWVEESLDSTIMTSDKKDLITISKTKQNGAWVNGGKDSSIYDAAGKHAEIVSMTWAAAAWHNSRRTVYMTTNPPSFTASIVRQMIRRSIQTLANGPRSNICYSITGRKLPALYSNGRPHYNTMSIYTRTAQGTIVVKR